MLGSVIRAFKIPDLRRRILYTLGLLLVFRVGAIVPVPNIDNAEFLRIFQQSPALLGFLDVISGGALKRFSVFAMSITPYINASIIVQLLTIIIPSWEEMAKETDGRKKLNEYTRYGTVLLGLLQAIGMTVTLRSAIQPFSFWTVALIALTLTAGTAFLMWLGEQITEKGIGNGISLLIFAGIVARLPQGAQNTLTLLMGGSISWFAVIALLAIAVAVIAFVVFIDQGERRIPVQYAKRVVGRRVYGGQSQHLPIKVNQAGVIPVIFAASLLQLPTIIASFLPNSGFARFTATWFTTRNATYSIAYFLLIVMFTFFYTSITFNPVEVSNNVKKYGGFIPGIRPGRPTTDFLVKVMTRITVVGAVFLGLIALLPEFVVGLTGVSVFFGGTSLLIVVGVALETMKQIESHLLMRHYQGFVK